MGRLRRPDLELVLGLIREIDGSHDPESFPGAVLEAIEQLVPCEWSAWIQVDFAGNEHREILRPRAGEPGSPDSSGEERRRSLRESPLVSHCRRTGEARVLALSELPSANEPRRIDLSRPGRGPLGREHQLLVPLDTPASGLTAVVLCRSSTDFSLRERDLLGLVRAHLVARYRAVTARARLEARLQALEDALAARGEGVAIVTGRDRVALATPCASECLAAFFDHGEVGHALPEELASWVRKRRAERAATPSARDPRDELVLERDGRCVFVRFVARGAEAGGDLLLFAEREHILSTESFAPLGLRRREAEVLALVARGLSDGEIANTLVVSRRTVEKHLEHIYQSLGVRGRTAAVAFALAAMGLPL